MSKKKDKAGCKGAGKKKRGKAGAASASQPRVRWSGTCSKWSGTTGAVGAAGKTGAAGAAGASAASASAAASADAAAGICVLGDGKAGWRFIFDEKQVPRKSSGVKLLVRGKYEDDLNLTRRTVDAYALFFPCECYTAFSGECISLTQANGIGVGPRLLNQTFCAASELSNSVLKGFGKALGKTLGKDDGIAVLIEEDAGISLQDAMQMRASPPNGASGCSPALLHEVGTEERARENDKIVLDILMQLGALHENGHYHRDLRGANVCVRRFGAEPEDIRATLIDFDLSSNVDAGMPRATEERLYKMLFGRDGERPKPRPLEHDLAYLEALLYELQTGLCVVGDGRGGFAQREPRFWNGAVLKRPERGDADALAQRLGLPALEDVLRGMPEDAVAAARRLKLGRYLDAAGRDMLNRDLDYWIAVHRERVARLSFEAYVAQRRAQGEEPEYERFEDQPGHLQDEGTASFLDSKRKIERLGYHLEWREDPVQADALEEFDEEEVERAAAAEHERWLESLRQKGYRSGAVKDHERKLHPLFDVSWEDLAETEKDKNRRIIRQIIPFMEMLGLAVCRNDKFGEYIR